MGMILLCGESGAGAFISATTPTTLVTNAQGAGKGVVFKKVLVCNVDEATNVWVSVYKVPSGGSISGTDYQIVHKHGINASAPNGKYGSEDMRECADLGLENGDSLRMLAETASKLRYDYTALGET